MPRWEYLFVEIDENRVSTINGQQIGTKANPGPPYYEYVNNIIGRDNWELIAAPYTTFSESSVTRGITFLRLIFKRPK